MTVTFDISAAGAPLYSVVIFLRPVHIRLKIYLNIIVRFPWPSRCFPALLSPPPQNTGSSCQLNPVSKTLGPSNWPSTTFVIWNFKNAWSSSSGYHTWYGKMLSCRKNFAFSPYQNLLCIFCVRYPSYIPNRFFWFHRLVCLHNTFSGPSVAVVMLLLWPVWRVAEEFAWNGCTDYPDRRSTWDLNPVPSTNEAGFVRTCDSDVGWCHYRHDVHSLAYLRGTHVDTWSWGERAFSVTFRCAQDVWLWHNSVISWLINQFWAIYLEDETRITKCSEFLYSVSLQGSGPYW